MKASAQKKSPRPSGRALTKASSKTRTRPILKRKDPDWRRLATERIHELIDAVQEDPQLKKMGPKSEHWQIGFELTTAAEMTALNSKYSGKKRPTDVLSFGAPEVFFENGVLGEIVICLPVLKKQARALKHDPRVELDVLLAHGICHLLGLDHEKGEREARQMLRMELRLLEKLRRGPELALTARSAPRAKIR